MPVLAAGALAAGVLAVTSMASGARVSSRAGSAHGGAAVSLVLRRNVFRAAQVVPVTVVNASAVRILRTDCFALARLTATGRWRTVTRTHGVFAACPNFGGIAQPAHTRQTAGLILYDDLHPGLYRVTLRYRPWPSGNVGSLRGRGERSLTLRITVLAPSYGPEPHLSEQRILSIARSASRGAGDAHPTLIQHAEGTRFAANRIGGGDLVFQWNWSYLIAIRGHFVLTDASVPQGAHAPAGSVFTLVIDAATGQETDGGVSNRYPDLAELGPVTTDVGR